MPFTGNNWFINGLINSKSDNCETENNFDPRRRWRINVIYCSSESEIELIQESNNTNSDITWKKNHFVPKIHPFISKRSRITKPSQIIDFFQLFISEELIDIIVEKPNYYWAQQSNNNENNLETTTRNKLYCFFTISLLVTHNHSRSTGA